MKVCAGSSSKPLKVRKLEPPSIIDGCYRVAEAPRDSTRRFLCTVRLAHAPPCPNCFCNSCFVPGCREEENPVCGLLVLVESAGDQQTFACVHTAEAMVCSQFTEEKLGQAEKTELDPHLENLLSRADATKNWTEKMLRQTEALLQPNPSE